VSDLGVSVGIPAHENASTIAATIESLRRQTFEDWDCHVSCDSTSSETFDAAAEAIDGDLRFTLATNRDRPGVAGNWNEVLTHASAPLFKLLCADDVLFPLALEIQTSALRENPTAVLCVGRRMIVDSRGRTIVKDRGMRGPTRVMDLDAVVQRVLKAGTNPLGEPSFSLYRTEALRTAGGFSTTWQYTIDLASYIDVLRRGDLVAVDAIVGQFRVSASSWSSTLAPRQSQEMRAVLDYALSASTLDVSRIGLLLARTRVVSTSMMRRVASRVSARGSTTR
jgi:glycosyltransferase involved in cell wall biosynthesis